MTRKQPENAEDLYARYFPLARATAARFLQGTGSDEDAEEVADDVMLELLAHPEKYDGGRGGLSTYVCVLARSRALNRRRTLTRRACLPLEEDILVESGRGTGRRAGPKPGGEAAVHAEIRVRILGGGNRRGAGRRGGRGAHPGLPPAGQAHPPPAPAGDHRLGSLTHGKDDAV